MGWTMPATPCLSRKYDVSAEVGQRGPQRGFSLHTPRNAAHAGTTQLMQGELTPGVAVTQLKDLATRATSNTGVSCCVCETGMSLVGPPA
jgi:hypothetical protein